MAAFISGMLGIGTGIYQGALVEPTDPAYARQPITINAVPGLVGANANAIAFRPTLTDWGLITRFVIYDSAGNSVYAGTIAVPIDPVVGDYVSFIPGALTITMPAIA